MALLPLSVARTLGPSVTDTHKALFLLTAYLFLLYFLNFFSVKHTISANYSLCLGLLNIPQGFSDVSASAKAAETSCCTVVRLLRLLEFSAVSKDLYGRADGAFCG